MAVDKKGEQGDSAVDEQKSRKTEISGAQVAGGALASVTAAFLGSHLGVAGTVFGAGLTSVVITVGGALYQRSLERTKEKLDGTKDRANATAAMAALKRATKIGAPDLPEIQQPRRGERRSAPSPADEATRKIRQHGGAMQWPGGELVLDEPVATRRIEPAGGGADEPTRRLRTAGGGSGGATSGAAAGTAGQRTRALGAARTTGATGGTELTGTELTGGDTEVTPAPGDAATEVVSPPAPRRRGLRWGVISATSALAFLFGMIVVTGWEGITGRTVAGDRGTTVGGVFRPAPQQPPRPAPQPEQTGESTTSEVPETTTAPTSGAPTPEPTGGPTSAAPTGAPTSGQPSGSQQTGIPQSSGQTEPQVPGTGMLGPTSETGTTHAP